MTINRWSTIFPLADADSDSATGGYLSEPSLNYNRTTMVYNEKPSLDYMYTVGLFSAPSLQSTTQSHSKQSALFLSCVLVDHSRQPKLSGVPLVLRGFLLQIPVLYPQTAGGLNDPFCQC